MGIQNLRGHLLILQILSFRYRYTLLDLLEFRLQNLKMFVVILIQLSLQRVKLALLLPVGPRT